MKLIKTTRYGEEITLKDFSHIKHSIKPSSPVVLNFPKDDGRESGYRIEVSRRELMLLAETFVRAINDDVQIYGVGQELKLFWGVK